MYSNSAIQAAAENERREIIRKRMFYLTISIVVMVACIIIWELAVDFKWVNTRFLDSPSGVLRRIIEKISDTKPEGGLLVEHIIGSTETVWLGFGFAAIIGVPLGLCMGWFRLFERVVRPLFEIIRPIPALAWIPIVLLFFGIGIEARAVVIFTGCFVSIVLNSYTGIRGTSQTLINVARTYGADNLTIFFRIGIPSALPLVFAGLKIAIGGAWSTVVAAEMLASSNGLGFLIQMGRQFGDVSLDHINEVKSKSSSLWS